MHTKHACEVYRCATIGERVCITGRHVDKFVKRDKQTIVLASEVHGEGGDLILSQRSTHIRALQPGVAKRVETRGTAELPRKEDVASDLQSLQVGSWLPPLAKVASREQLIAFAGVEWPNIHTDESIARAAGLQGCIASGLQTMAYVSELLARCLGDGWRIGGRIEVAFTAPLLANVAVYACARVREIATEGGCGRAIFDVWCDTQAGLRVLAGTASARLALGQASS